MMRSIATIMAAASISGCAALEAAAPMLLETTERIIRAEIDRAEDPSREQELWRALALLRECREAHAIAEEAARQATEAAVLAEEAAERTAREREAAERVRAELLQERLRASLVRLRVVTSQARASKGD